MLLKKASDIKSSEITDKKIHMNRRIGEDGRRKSLMFNGYADQVGQLYSGMDLRKFY